MPLGFNGTYTIQNLSSEEHRTFSIKTQPDGSRFAPGKRVVALLTGPNNESDYQGFGFLNDDGIAVWKSKRGQGKLSAFDHYARILHLAVTSIHGDDEEVQGKIDYAGRTYEVRLSKTCRVCNRKLTDPTSIRNGIGKTCSERVGL